VSGQAPSAPLAVNRYRYHGESPYQPPLSLPAAPR